MYFTQKSNISPKPRTRMLICVTTSVGKTFFKWVPINFAAKYSLENDSLLISIDSPNVFNLFFIYPKIMSDLSTIPWNFWNRAWLFPFVPHRKRKRILSHLSRSFVEPASKNKHIAFNFTCFASVADST